MVTEIDPTVKRMESQRSSRALSSRSRSMEMLLNRLRAIKSKEEEDKLASILDAVGEFGPFQRRLVALTFIPNILAAFFMFADSLVFTAQKAYCNTSWILAMYPNLSEAEQMNLTLPRESNGSFLTCLMYSPVDWNLDSIIQFGLNRTEMCQDGWIYPKSKKRMLTDEFDLVCGKEFNWELAMTVYMAGFLIGSVTFGFLCDRLGRYPTILVSLLGLTIFGFGTAFVNSMESYLFFRFSVAQAVAGYGISSMSLVTEWLVGVHRARAIIVSHCYFTAGILILSGLAYSIPHWRLLFLVGGAPVFCVIPYIWVLPESPRWLMLRGKVEEAKQILCRAASVNKKVIPLNLLTQMHLSGKKPVKTSVLDFYGNRYLRKVTLVMGCLWFTISYTYLTLSLKVKDFGVNPYTRQVIPSLMEVPARLCCVLLLEHLGRKWTLALTLLQASLVCLLVLLLPQGEDGPRLRWPCWLATELKFTVVLVILLGEFSLAGSVTLLFIYTAELLPTVLRATGLGLVSLAFAAGAISSLTILRISQSPSILPTCLSCASAVLALYLCSLLPETQDLPLADTIEHISSQLSLQKEASQDSWFEDPSEALTEDTSSEDVSEEAAKNAILNTMVQKVDSKVFVTRLQQPRE
ncbi:solute carrier family 22 member 14 [Elephas maximus indicus]|uniref:solute carrier family 22 member 14 n=1 Tax=Elephas maximus indicus TaxID=99487 RepID=UPI0021168EEA|nr:solute carrier family 22 member 14 [Elephas maximus indicus]